MTRKLTPFWTLFILTGLNLFNYFDRYVLSAVLPSVQRDLALTDSQNGWLGTAFMLGYFLTSPVFGYLGDRASRKWLIASGIFVWSMGTLLTGFAATFAWMIGFRVLVGLGEASYATISPSYISDSFVSRRRNNALTIFYVAIPVGAALGTMIGGMISEHWGWRYAFIWAGAPGLLLALMLLPFAEPERGAADHTGHLDKPRMTDVFKLFRIPEYVLVVGGYAAYTFALGAFALWGPTFLNRVHGMPEADAAKFFGAVLVVAGLVGTFVGGFAATAWQKRNRAAYAWVLGLSVLVALPAAAGAFLTRSHTISMACLAASMFLLFLGTGPVNTLILETVPVNLRASAMAMSIFTIHLLGDVPSPLIVGWLSDLLQSLQIALLILPVALAVGAGLWLVLALRLRRAPFKAA
jgi:MFS transporter, Spinster family, sphingosine-1-phosphate transporter